MATVKRLVTQVIVLVFFVVGSGQAYAAQASGGQHRVSQAKVNLKTKVVAAKRRASVKARTLKARPAKKRQVANQTRRSRVVLQSKNFSAKTASKLRSKAVLAKQSRVLARSNGRAVAKQARMIPYQHAVGKYEPFVQASSVLVVDQRTNKLIYAKNHKLKTPVASITKLMTALVTLEANLPLREQITITAEDVDRIKHTRSRLRLGTKLTREELLHLALIASENRAAAALSRAYPGGRRAFVAAMNRKARELGMVNTYFVDGTGLSSHNRSTAEDLVKLVQAAYRNPLIRHITTTPSYDVGERGLVYVNTNRLVRQSDWEIGVSKTGFINEAGYCLVMQARIAGQPVIIVLLDSLNKWSRISDAERIRKWLESGAMQRYTQHSVRDVSA